MLANPFLCFFPEKRRMTFKVAHAKFSFPFCASERRQYISKMSKGGGKALELDFEPRERPACPNKEFRCSHRWVISGLWTRARVCVCSETMSVQTFHWVQTHLDRCHEMLQTLKKNRRQWVKRQHLALKAYQVSERLRLLIAALSSTTNRPTAHPFITPLCK